MLIGYDSTGAVIWRGETLPKSDDGIYAIPENVVEIEDDEMGHRLVLNDDSAITRSARK